MLNMIWMYIILFIGSFLAAAISGAAGFGGALLLLPLLYRTVGTSMAIPILTIAQLIGNVSRSFFGFKQISWKPVMMFILGAALFLSLNLSPVGYIASEAVTAISMHIAKKNVYQRYLKLSAYALKIGLFMGVAMMGGTWAGKTVIEKMSIDNFVKFVGILLALIGFQMLIWG